ncbi:helix-turn-helix transcriptional regulator [Sulfitobacter sp. HNIBRBA3233]|uniref:helix-turn-helix domain-containing protein n=1 Tax=Sulfitobacter marinivivus TaxID=3158558 RepID=UPI0032DEF363
MPRSHVNDRSNLVPFPGASDTHARIASALALVTDWNAALSGHISLQDVLALYARIEGAAQVSLMRYSRGKVLPVATAVGALGDPDTGTCGGFLRAALLQKGFSANAADVLHLSEVESDPMFAPLVTAGDWRNISGGTEVRIIVLESTSVQLDTLEVVFADTVKDCPDLPSAMIAQALADAWTVRAPGLISRAIRNFGRTRASAASGQTGGILGIQNRCGLSRSERRVCQMLAAGGKARDIAESLRISIPTVRTHLRNIYAKTETSGQVELLAAIASERDAAG